MIRYDINFADYLSDFTYRIGNMNGIGKIGLVVNTVYTIYISNLTQDK